MPTGENKSSKKRELEHVEQNEKNKFSSLVPKKLGTATVSEKVDSDGFVKPSGPSQKKSKKIEIDSVPPSPGGSDVYDSDTSSVPRSSTDLSFTDELSISEDPISSSVDDFAQNKMEIKLDSKTEEELQEKINKSTSNRSKDPNNIGADEQRGVIYLGHIPHGFYEDQMRIFFSKFGKVTRCVLVRSRRTGRSKGYAFIEFDDKDVAEIVADTMDNYLIFGRRLKSGVVPPNKVNHGLLSNASKQKFVAVDWHLVERVKTNRKLSDKEKEDYYAKLLRKEEKLRKRIDQVGIDYKFPGFASLLGASTS